ncbi:MAG TPA: NUDIX domain-containing protein [Trueperaceae bacterium]
MAVTRDFTATAFVVWRGRVLLHRHRKLDLWLPCGGHVEPHELPDDAAVREVFEESGVEVELVGERALGIAEPRQLLRPRGVQLELMEPGHEHIDLIYWARPAPGYDGHLTGEAGVAIGWFGPEELRELDLTEEIRNWTRLALVELGEPQSEEARQEQETAASTRR